MIIRAIESKDEEQIEEIRKRHYSDEFSPVDFRDKFLCAFVVEDQGKIITAGGIRTIAEAIALTDKSINYRQRVRALREMLKADAHIARTSGYNQLHAFIQDYTWSEHLVKKEFRHTKGNALVLNLED